MKFVHLSDLHLGKRVNGFSMIEDQQYILEEILKIIAEEKPQAVLISGDIYDKSIPPAEAVQLFDDFLVSLSRDKLQVFVISGNHDSAERIAFGSRLMDQSGVHLSPVYDGYVEPVRLTDEYGPVDFFMLPFIRPVHVRHCFPDDEIKSYSDALACAVSHMPVDPAVRNVLLTHQFVTGAVTSDSEDISVGGTDNVDAAVFEAFDYTALGHIHAPQNAGGERIRYCGTPLKYSFSEASHQKSVTIVEMMEKSGGLSADKAEIRVRTVPLKPRRDLREIRGSYLELTAAENYRGTAVDDYLHVTLTDEEDVFDAIGKLRSIYPNIMKLDYDNCRTRSNTEITGNENTGEQSPLELFAEFYSQQNNQPLSEEQEHWIGELINKIWEGEQ